MANKKYELMKDDTIKAGGKTLYRIKALKNLKGTRGNVLGVRKGDIGGYIQSEDNLSHDGTCWVDNDAIVYGNGELTTP